MHNSRFFNIVERLVSCLTYPSCGLVGIVWLIISLAFLKKTPKPIILYHIYQSIFVWMLIAVVGFVLNLIINLIIMIPVLGTFIANIMLFFNTPIYFGLSIINLLISILLLYLMLCAIIGRYSNLPFISKIIKWNVNRQC